MFMHIKFDFLQRNCFGVMGKVTDRGQNIFMPAGSTGLRTHKIKCYPFERPTIGKGHRGAFEFRFLACL